MMFTQQEINEIRKDFEYLQGNPKVIYFDNGATSQKPKKVTDALVEYYQYENGNPHRGAHYFAMKSTEVYEGSRERVARFIGAKKPAEVVFLRNATEALNLLAYSYGLYHLEYGDEILISILEHHSNLVPWQFVAQKTGAEMVFLRPDEDMQITEEELLQKVTSRTRIFSVTAASNVVGTMPDVKTLIRKVREIAPDVCCIVDASQYVPHHKLDVTDLDCDFLVFSGHKMLSAMGIGVLYGKEERLNAMEPFFYGGDMIEYVYECKSSYLPSPQRFEAGTVNVGGAKSLAVAMDYLEALGMDKILEYESALMNYAYDKMKKLDDVDIYTTSNLKRSPVLSFNIKDVHPHDVASILDHYHIAVRSGHHCAQPLHRSLGMNFSCRASFAFYNTFEEIDAFINHMEDVRRMMGLGLE